MNRRNKPRYKLILNMPDLVAKHTKIGSSVVTAVCWMFFVYLWMPLITLIAWFISADHAYDEIRFAHEITNLERLTVIYGLIVLALGGSLLLWAWKEYLRFHNVNRRREPIAVENAELAAYTNLQADHIGTWQHTRRMVAHHASDGSIMRIVEVAA
jgi:biofilm PGA synthesis protein PgaD